MAYYVFLILGFASLIFGALVIFGRNPAICAVNLVGAFFCLSGIYLLIGFPFLAALQLIVYAGAIMVLFVFVIMLFDLKKEEPASRPLSAIGAPILAACVLALLAYALPGLVPPPEEIARTSMGPMGPVGGEGSTSGGRDLAIALFSRNVLAFEATSLLLLAAIVGVIVFAKKLATREALIAAGENGPRQLATPLPPRSDAGQPAPEPAGAGGKSR